MFRLTKYIGPGRIGKFELNGKKIQTPNLAENVDISFLKDFKQFEESKRSISILPDINIGYTVPREYVDPYFKEAIDFRKVHNNGLLGVSVPVLKDLTATFDFMRVCESFDLIILKNIGDLMLDSKKASLFLIKMRTILREDQLVYVPGVITPNMASFLSFFGVDFIDTSFAKIAAEKGMMLLESGYLLSEDLETNVLYQKARDEFFRSIDAFKLHAKNNTVYNYIESLAYSDPNIYSVLKTLYIEYFEYLDC